MIEAAQFDGGEIRTPLVANALHDFDVCRARMQCRVARRDAFHFGPRSVELSHFLRRQRRDDETVAAGAGHEALRLEHLKRLAYWCAAYTEPFGQIGFAQALSCA